MVTPTTSTGVVNLSLRAIGAERISDLATDTSIRGVQLQDLYEQGVRFLLRRGDWSFAQKRVQLTEDTAAPPAGWDNQFPLPTDWIRTVSVSPYDDDQGRGYMPYEMSIVEPAVSPDDAGRKIWCNSSTCWLRYVYDQTAAGDPAYWPPDFIEAVAEHLAVKLIEAKVKSTVSKEDKKKDARRSLAIAMSNDGIEDDQLQFPEGSWVTSRFL